MRIYCIRENLKNRNDRFQWFDFLTGVGFGVCAGMGLLMLAGLL